MVESFLAWLRATFSTLTPQPAELQGSLSATTFPYPLLPCTRISASSCYCFYVNLADGRDFCPGVPSLSHHTGEAITGCAYMQFWLANCIPFESSSQDKLTKRKFTLPAHTGSGEGGEYLTRHSSQCDGRNLCIDLYNYPAHFRIHGHKASGGCSVERWRWSYV